MLQLPKECGAHGTRGYSIWSSAVAKIWFLVAIPLFKGHTTVSSDEHVRNGIAVSMAAKGLGRFCSQSATGSITASLCCTGW
jgi:hypothetical protein